MSLQGFGLRNMGSWNNEAWFKCNSKIIIGKNGIKMWKNGRPTYPHTHLLACPHENNILKLKIDPKN